MKTLVFLMLITDVILLSSVFDLTGPVSPSIPVGCVKEMSTTTDNVLGLMFT